MSAEPNPTSNDDARSVHNAPHPAGVRRVLIIFAALIIAAAVPYLVPATAVAPLGLGQAHLDRMKAWELGDPVPFTRFLEFSLPVRPSVGGQQEHIHEVPVDEEELMEAAQLPEPAATEPVAPIDDTDELRIPPGEYAGMTAAIDDPDEAMEHFYEALAAVARDHDGALARIGVYSDSINGSDRMTSALRALMQERFGDGGKGFVPMRPGWQYQRHHDVEWEQGGSWSVRVVNRGELPDGRYGLGGVRVHNRTPIAWTRFGTVADGPVGGSVAFYRILYQAWPEGGALSFAVDGGEPGRIDLAADTAVDRVHEVHVPDGAHELEVRVADGDARVYGVVMEREGPGVVVDGLMLVGAFTRVLLNFDAAHFQQQHRERGTDLVVFWMGGNDSVSDTVGFRRDQFISNYPQVLRRTTEMGEVSCLVMTVLDSAEEVDGQVRSRRRVPRVVDAQIESARAAGCAVWNAYEAIGGTGTMLRWFRSSPRLAAVDYRHLTPEGARVVATLFHKALLRGFDDYLARQGEGGGGPGESGVETAPDSPDPAAP